MSDIDISSPIYWSPIYRGLIYAHIHDLFTDQKENDVFNNEIRKGFLKMILMKIIKDKPTHGYEIIHLIQEKSGGRWTPSPGSVYPALEHLVRRATSSARRSIAKRCTPSRRKASK